MSEPIRIGQSLGNAQQNPDMVGNTHRKDTVIFSEIKSDSHTIIFSVVVQKTIQTKMA